jgi:hypothetical protein
MFKKFILLLNLSGVILGLVTFSRAYKALGGLFLTKDTVEYIKSCNLIYSGTIYDNLVIGLLVSVISAVLTGYFIAISKIVKTNP